MSNFHDTHYVSFLTGQDGAVGNTLYPNARTRHRFWKYFSRKYLRSIKLNTFHLLLSLFFSSILILFATYYILFSDNSSGGHIPVPILDNVDITTYPENIHDWLPNHFEKSFGEFINRYNKSYPSVEEKQRRFEVYKTNLITIFAHNAEGHSYSLGMNAFGDISWEEFRRTYLGYEKTSSIDIPSYLGISGNKDDSMDANNQADMPARVDWRDNKCVSPIRNQGKCMSCWAFSSLGAVEGAWCKKTGKLVTLSEQMLVDCSERNGKCSGGLLSEALDFVAKEGGVCTDEAYPYLGREQACRSKQCQHMLPIKGFMMVMPENEMAMKRAIYENGPVSVAVHASIPSFQFYKSGVYNAPCGTDLDHGVLLVGFGHDDRSKMDYFIMKNSWGVEWGDNGFMYMAQHVGPSGQCGVLLQGFFPTL